MIDLPRLTRYVAAILEVSEAQQVIFLKRSMRPGFAGIENELLYIEVPVEKTSLMGRLFGRRAA